MPRWLQVALGLILLLLFKFSYTHLVNVSPFQFWQQDLFVYFLIGSIFGLALALVVRSEFIGILCGILPLIICCTIGSADQPVWGFVFTFIVAWGFLGTFWFVNALIKIFSLSWHFTLDTAPKD
jgi:hypothetical protein